MFLLGLGQVVHGCSGAISAATLRLAPRSSRATRREYLL